MKEIYGVIDKSPLFIYDYLKKYTKYKIVYYPKIGDIVIINSVNNFNYIYDKYINKNIIIIICDMQENLLRLSPIKLINNTINIIDINNSYKNNFIIKSNIKIIKQKNIFDIITEFKKYSFIDKYNKLYYKISKINRESIKDLFINYLFGKISFNKFDSDIKIFLPNRGKILEYYNEIIIYFNTKDGINLLKCLRSLNLKKCNSITYITMMATKYNVEIFDINYFIHAFLHKKSKI